MSTDHETPPETGATPHRHRGHGWMMLLMCAPLLVIAVVLTLTGLAGSGLIIGAVVCALMMGLMMVGMGRGGPAGRT
ncbi:hypothetical protein [Amycolatopsis thermoflava]|uniref:hypothetical protein n=1 Tax=Amycolatopsis thermoflava TaxID=84480 RepID=UPI0038211E24